MQTLLFLIMIPVFWAGFPSFVWAQNQGRELVIIVNKANPTEEISLAELRKIFLAERAHWSHGGSITIAMRDAGQSERMTILQQVCQMTEGEFNRYYLQATFTGQVQTSPKRFATAAGVRDFVAAVPGAIGYLRVNELNGTIKALRVNGRLPSDTGYGLVDFAP